MGPESAERPARSGDDLLDGAQRSSIPGGLDVEHAERLINAARVSGKKFVNRVQGVIAEEIWAVLDRLVVQHTATHTDVVGALTIIVHDVMHHAMRQAEKDEGDND